MKKAVSLCLLFMVLYAISKAQSLNKVITGKITDANNKGLAAATIILKRQADSSLIKTAISNDLGEFRIENLKADTIVMTVTSVGYRSYNSKSFVIGNDSSAVVMPDVVLQQNDPATLAAVTVVDRRKFIEIKIDRTVVNVGAWIGNVGANALDVLERSPGVRVDNYGSISLQGRGVTILVDGRPTHLAGPDLLNYLKSLPADFLDKIELMPVPPSKYDAAGAGGIINIIIKKNIRRGFNGNVTANYGQGVYQKIDGSFYMNYKNRKMNIFTNFGYGIPEDFSQTNEDRIFKDASGNILSELDQRSFVKNDRKNLNAKAGIDFFVTKKTTIGLIYNGFRNVLKETGTNTSQVLNPNKKIDSIVYADNNADEKFRNSAVNFNLVHRFDSTGKELNFDVDWAEYRSNNDQVFANYIYTPDGNLSNTDILLGYLPRKINIYSVKADYTQPLKNNMRLEFGFKSSLVKTNNVADYFAQKGNVISPDYEKTNTFLYDENINAAYASIAKERKRWGVKLGLRMEHTNADGDQLGNMVVADSSFSRSYVNLFPSAFFSLKLDTTNTHQLFLSYSRRLDRPSYDQLNPFLSVAQRYYYLGGNPFLQPQFSSTVQLTYQFKWNFTTNIYYGYLENAFNNVINVSGDKYITRPGNVGSVSVLGFLFLGNYNPTKWWTIYAVFNPENTHIKSVYNNKQVDTVFWVGSFNFGSQFNFEKGWNLQFESNWGSRSFTGQYAYKARYGFGIGVRKQVLKNKGTLSFRFNDIFYSSIARGTILNVSQTDAIFRNPTDSRVATLSFSLRFGKDNFERNRNERDATMDEKMRVRQ